MPLRWFAFALAGLLVGAGAARAEDGKIDAGALIQKLANQAQGLEKRFDKLDVNHDGAVDRSEIQAATDKAFSRLDKNKDGVIDKDELARFKEKIAAKRGDKAADMAAHRFEKADKDRDGKVTREEFNAAIPQWFEKADANGDGKVTKEEIANSVIKIRNRAEKKAGEAASTEGKSDKDKAQDKPKTDEKADPSDDDDDVSADAPGGKDDGSKK